MKRFLFGLSALLLFFPGSIFAHTLKIDGTIGVSLHIDPDDAPTAGQESKFFLDITDKAGRFNPSNPGNCACVLHIEYDGELLKTFPVVSGGSFTQIRYTFPHTGTYKVTIEGRPQGEGIPFAEFRTVFEPYVAPGVSEEAREATSANILRQYIPYVSAALGVAIVLLFLL